MGRIRCSLCKIKRSRNNTNTADDAYLTSFIGYHFARYIGQDGVKSLVTGEEYNGESVTWDDEKVKAAAESFADFAKKGYFSKISQQTNIQQDRIRNSLLVMQQSLSVDHGFQMKQKIL